MENNKKLITNISHSISSKSTDILKIKSITNKFNFITEQTEDLDAYSVKPTHINPVRKVKHFPPATKEWTNSTYTYNNSVTKNLPILDKQVSKIITGYFNLYNDKLRRKIRKHRSRRFEIRRSRRLMNKVFIGKPELKHGNDSIGITVYIYNAEKKYLSRKILKIPAVYKANRLDKSNLLSKRNKLANDKLIRAKTLYMKKANKASLNLKSKLSKYKDNFFILKRNDVIHKNFLDINKYKKHYFKSYVKKCLRKETISVFYKQMLAFNKSKFEMRYVLLLANSIAKIYNKKVRFNFVNLKHMYLDSNIFSKGLATKLKRLAKRKRSFLLGLKKFLAMFKVPRINTLDIYNEMFNRQILSQNVNNNNLKANFSNVYDISKQDFIDDTLNIAKLTTDADVSKYNNLNILQSLSVISKAFSSVKYKIINGVRLEIAGRFTKRTSAARSVFKIRNKGSVKNKNSSLKGLPTTLVKGYAKSNLQHNKFYSKVRGGSFGIKSSLSGA